ncbi:MAG: DUF222 domain-containing protein, partial [Steroidobacteraceae bacterium]
STPELVDRIITLAGALFVKALQAAEDALPIPKDVPSGTSDDEGWGPRQRRIEALTTLAQSFLATGPKDLSGAHRQQIVVHVEAETLKHSEAGRCELEHGPSIANWTGGGFDLGLGVEVLMQMHRRGKSVSAETPTDHPQS